MRDYGKVSPQFWIGETGKALRGNPDAQVLALYLMTSPHATMTGVFHCPVIYMAHETGLTTEGALKGLARLIEVGFCEYDEASESVFVVNMAAYQIDDALKPDDKRVLGLRREVAKMAPARFQSRFVQVYGERFHLVEHGKNASPLQAPCKPLPSQEQEQEQDKNPSASVKPDDGFDAFWSAYPKKKSKGAALKAWGKLKAKRETLALILAALAWQTKTHDWTKEGGQFIPYPASYLNSQGWLDAPTTGEPATQAMTREEAEAKRRAALAAAREAYQREAA